MNKNGKKKGKQNYICVYCGRQFIDRYEGDRGYSDRLRRECLSIIINWVKQVGELLPCS
ncbi:MAG: IS1 family transposase, partial [Trichodesmium sp. St2_bin6]|nr:IS1 family transposase [Trichodesmium sp. St2_bin6]